MVGSGAPWKTPLSTTDFEKYYSKNNKFGGVFSRDNIPKLQKKFYIINLDDRTGPGTHWVLLYNLRKRPLYFDSFGVYPPDEITQKVKNLVFNEYRIQDMTSKNCGLFCMFVANELLRGKKCLDILLNFSPTNYIDNDDLILRKMQKKNRHL